MENKIKKIDNYGWISLHRKIFDNPIFDNSVGLKIWIWCLLKAGREEKDILIGRKKIHLLKGQFVFGSTTACEQLKLSKSTIHYWMEFLKVERYIERKTTNKYSIITVLNYNQYQKIERQVERKWNANGTQNETNNNDNNDNNDNNVKERERDREKENTFLDVGLDKTSLTREELWSMCLKTKVDLNDVMRKYYSILDMIEAGEFQRRYPKHKNLKFTLMSWLRMDVARGYVEGANETERLLNTKRDPKTEAGRDFFERWEKGRKEGTV